MWLGLMSNYGRFPSSVTLDGVGSMGWLGNEGIDAGLISSLVTVFVHRDQFQKKCSSTLYGMTFGIQYLALDFVP